MQTSPTHPTHTFDLVSTEISTSAIADFILLLDDYDFLLLRYLNEYGIQLPFRHAWYPLGAWANALDALAEHSDDELLFEAGRQAAQSLRMLTPLQPQDVFQVINQQFRQQHRAVWCNGTDYRFELPSAELIGQLQIDTAANHSMLVTDSSYMPTPFKLGQLSALFELTTGQRDVIVQHINHPDANNHQNQFLVYWPAKVLQSKF
jgi:hypothetical protein